MNRFERRVVFGMLFGVVAQTSPHPLAGLVMGCISICYLVAAIFTEDTP